VYGAGEAGTEYRVGAGAGHRLAYVGGGGRSRVQFALAAVLVACVTGGASPLGAMPAVRQAAAGAASPLGAVPAGPGAAAGAPAPRVLISDDEFSSPRVDVAVDVAVTFDQRGRHPHTITADGGGFDTGNLEPGEELRLRFPAAGVYRYHCALHGATGGHGMSAVVVVGDAPIPPGPEPRTPRPGGPATVNVPKDKPTVQEAVDAAQPGDLVLVAPGTYKESVVVATPGIELRGVDRNAVVLDGEGTRSNGVLVAADGVTVGNLTAVRFRVNGFLWWGVKGFRGSYLSAAGNGSYGMRVYGSKGGVIDHAYASGQPDAGIAVAACSECATTVSDSTAERNAVGFLAANAAGGVVIARSEAAGNGAGIVGVPLDSTTSPVLRGLVVVGNRVHGNGRRLAAHPMWLPASGAGIVVAGATGARIERNLVEGNRDYGVVVSPAFDRALRLSRGGAVRGNSVHGNGGADLALGAPAGGGTCFAANRHRLQAPPGLTFLSRCGAATAGLTWGDPGVTASRLALWAEGAGAPAAEPRPGPSDVPPQPSMPEAAGPPRPATGALPVIDPESIALAQPTAASTQAPKEAHVFGVKLSDPIALALGMYAYLLPLALYAAWISVSMWDLARREGLSGPARVGLAAIVLGVPVLGPVGYLAVGARSVPRGLRLFLAFGGLALYALLATVSLALGSA
jgi:plastocyanin